MDMHGADFSGGYTPPIFADTGLPGGPGVLARRVVTENSDELVRIQHGSRKKELGYMCSRGGEMSVNGMRSILIKTIVLAHQDIVSGMRREDPRRIPRNTRTGVVYSENHEFRSAVSFLFSQQQVFDVDGKVIGHYSAFNSYCQLLELDAPRLRRMILDEFEGLDKIVREEIPRKEFRAAVAGKFKRF